MAGQARAQRQDAPLTCRWIEQHNRKRCKRALGMSPLTRTVLCRPALKFVWQTPVTSVRHAGGTPLLPGESDLDQLGRVAQLFGGLSPRLWPGIAAAPDFGKLRFKPVPRVPLERLLPRAPPAAVALLRRMLHLDPGAVWLKSMTQNASRI